MSANRMLFSQIDLPLSFPLGNISAAVKGMSTILKAIAILALGFAVMVQRMGGMPP